MNWIHRRLCASDGWRQRVATEILPWVLKGVELGSNVLEVGPGPGLTTDALHGRVDHLTCVEIDSRLAASLQERMAGSNVTVLHEDATAMPLPDGSFDSAVCFTMLHHVPSVELQDKLLREVGRVLKPGAFFVGIDSRLSLYFRMLHILDTMVVVNPSTFPSRLKKAGFCDVKIELAERAFRFQARRAA